MFFGNRQQFNFRETGYLPRAMNNSVRPYSEVILWSLSFLVVVDQQ